MKIKTSTYVQTIVCKPKILCWWNNLKVFLWGNFSLPNGNFLKASRCTMNGLQILKDEIAGKRKVELNFTTYIIWRQRSRVRQSHHHHRRRPGPCPFSARGFWLSRRLRPRSPKIWLEERLHLHHESWLHQTFLKAIQFQNRHEILTSMYFPPKFEFLD